MKKIYKKITYIFALLFVLHSKIIYASIKEWMLWTTEDWADNISDISRDDGLSMLSKIFRWAKDEIMSMVWILAVWVFIFIWIRIIMARWNPEEFKKSILHFVYAIIWVFFIFMAWWLVKLVSTLSL